MKRFTKRLISVLICLAIAVAILPVAAFAATTTVYCQAPDDWTKCNAYWWGSSTENPDWPGLAMTQDENGIWGYNVPSDATGLIFNNDTQTPDLTVPTDEKNMYVFANNYWKEYGRVDPVEEYFVAGVGALCGVDWQPGAAQNKMSDNGDGTFSMTYTGVAAGSYELKVTMGSWASCWGAPDSTDNYVVTVDNDDSAVVICFDKATKLVSHLINPVPDVPDVPEVTTLIGEGSATFETPEAAWDNPAHMTFVPGADGIVKIDITACDPGFYVEIEADGEWIEDCLGVTAKVIEFPVTAGVTYDFYITSGLDTIVGADKVAGSVSYKLTANVAAGEPNTGDEEDPGDSSENSESNPQAITSFYGNYIEVGQTMWFIYDNTEHMMNDASYSQMLYINSGAPYAVTYRGQDVPVDDKGFVVYEMNDMTRQGTYVFSVTNNGAVKAYFTIEVKDPVEYVISEYTLALGDNVVLPDPAFSKTLYEFAPEATGVYSFKISEGFIGNWGTYFNPVDNTGTQDTMLQWTCNAVGQGVMIGVTGTEEAILSVEKIAEYTPPVEAETIVYKNTYDFSYQLPENPDLVKIDVLDNDKDVAVLDKNGFYRYGSENGPLMFADLANFPINLADAALNGQLRAYIYDDDGNVVTKYDYNDAMSAYLQKGLVPVTEELARMLKQIGAHHNWWSAGGFVFENDAPADEESAWMVACSWLKGSEVEPETDVPGGNTPGGNNPGGNKPSGGEEIPKTVDISMAWAMIALVVASACLVILKKKESFFLH